MPNNFRKLLKTFETFSRKISTKKFFFRTVQNFRN